VVSLRRFSGNVLLSRIEQHVEETAVIRPGEAVEIGGRDVPQILRVEAPDHAALHVVAPAWGDEPCTLTLVRTSSGRLLPTFALRHAQANLLLGYLQSGQLDQAKATAESASMQAEQLLAGKLRQPVAAIIGAYALLRFSALRHLHDWTENLKNWFPTCPDGAAIRGEHLARLGLHRDALRCFLELPQRGLPIFRDGLSASVDRLRQYRQLGSAHFDETSLRAAADALERLERFVPAIAFKQPILTYTGLSPTEPQPRNESESTMRVLLVEDHGPTLGVVALLKEAGHHVTTAHSVAEALRAAKRTNIDLVISDLDLADGSGLEMMAKLRAAQPELRGIALSRKPAADDPRRLSEAGFTTHLTRPMDLDRLRQAVGQTVMRPPQ
jgi:CheY-like chemotaxis protein